MFASALCIMSFLIVGIGCSEVEDTSRPVDTETPPTDGDGAPPTDDDGEGGDETPPTDGDETPPTDDDGEGDGETPPTDDDGAPPTDDDGEGGDPVLVALSAVAVVALIGVAAWWMIGRQDPDEQVGRPDDWPDADMSI